MVSCSRRRKTKSPFCTEDPKCYWNNKSCKKRPGMNNNTRRHTNNYRPRPQFDSNTKLNLIIQKLNAIESAIRKMTRKNTNNVRTLNAPKRNLNRNNNASVKTASPTNVALLLSQSKNDSAKTASPNAVNRLKELMKN